MEIDSLEDLVSKQVETINWLISNSQNEIVSVEKLADFIPQISLPEPLPK